MISRERLRCALEHREADAVPIDFGAMRSTGICAIAYGNLRRFLNLPERPVRVYDMIQLLAESDRDVVQRLRADVVQLHRLCTVAGMPNDEWRAGRLENGTSCLFPRNYSPWINEKGEKHLLFNGSVYAKMPAGGMYYDRVFHPYEEVSTTSDIDEIPIDPISDYELLYLQRRAEELYKNTEYGILGAFGGGFFEVGQGDFGFEKYYYNLAMEPTLIHHYNRRLCNASGFGRASSLLGGIWLCRLGLFGLGRGVRGLLGGFLTRFLVNKKEMIHKENQGRQDNSN